MLIEYLHIINILKLLFDLLVIFFCFITITDEVFDEKYIGDEHDKECDNKTYCSHSISNILYIIFKIMMCIYNVILMMLWA